MLEFLRDPALQVLIGVLGIIVTVALYFSGKHHKELVYEILPRIQIVANDRETIEKLVMANKTLQSDGKLVALKFINSGQDEILPGDFIEPIEISFGKAAKVHFYKITEVSPNSLKVDAIHIEKQVDDSLSPFSLLFIKPLLLKKGESFTLVVLVSNFQAPSVKERITGIKTIYLRTIQSSKITLLIMWSGILTYLITQIAEPYVHKNLMLALLSLSLLLMIIGLARGFRALYGPVS